MKRPHCEVMIKTTIPLIRACLAHILTKECGISIYHASKMLGVTPAAISNYLSNKRSRVDAVMKALKDDTLGKEMRKWASEIIKGNVEAGDVICILCRKYGDIFRKIAEDSLNNNIVVKSGSS